MKAKAEVTPGFWQQLREDWDVNGKDWTAPGFRAVAVYRFGTSIPKVRNKLVRVLFSRLYLTLYRFIRNIYGIELPSSTKVGRRFRIAHQNGIVIHPHSEIGDDCIIRQNVTMGAASDDSFSHAPIVGNDVHVGAGAALLGNVMVGNGARIGANTVVMTDVPEGALVFNTRSKILKHPKTVTADREEREKDCRHVTMG